MKSSKMYIMHYIQMDVIKNSLKTKQRDAKQRPKSLL